MPVNTILDTHHMGPGSQSINLSNTFQCFCLEGIHYDIGKRDSMNQQKVEMGTNHQEWVSLGDTVNLRRSSGSEPPGNISNISGTSHWLLCFFSGPSSDSAMGPWGCPWRHPRIQKWWFSSQGCQDQGTRETFFRNIQNWGKWKPTRSNQFWLVVWNFFYFSIYWE